MQGEALGCGAHLVALRREAIGELRVGAAWQLPDLVAAIDLQRRAMRVSPVPAPPRLSFLDCTECGAAGSPCHPAVAGGHGERGWTLCWMRIWNTAPNFKCIPRSSPLDRVTASRCI